MLCSATLHAILNTGAEVHDYGMKWKSKGAHFVKTRAGTSSLFTSVRRSSGCGGGLSIVIEEEVEFNLRGMWLSLGDRRNPLRPALQ
jgi:hypothetical protein